MNINITGVYHRMKKLMMIALAALLALSIVGCSKDNDQTNIGNIEEELNNNDALIVGNFEFAPNESGDYEIVDFIYNGSTPITATIPARFDGRPVTGIAEEAFKSATLLTSVTFEEGSSIKYIGDFAFHGCTGLTAFDIPETVVEIGNGAFWGCSALETVGMPEALETVGNYAFWGCKVLKSVEFPEREVVLNPDTKEYEGYLTIGEGAFFDCDALTEVTFPTNTKTIGKGAFIYCDAITGINVKSATTELGEGVFAGCTNAVKITAPADSKAAEFAAKEELEFVVAQ